MNAKNPMFKEIVDQGISVSEFIRLFSGSGKMNWSDLIRGGQNKPVNPYIIDNAEIKTVRFGFHTNRSGCFKR